MNLTVLSTNGDVFVNCECIQGYSFKMVLAPRDKSVYMTILNASCHKYKS